MQWVRLRDSHTPHHTTVITTRTSRTARACLTLYTHAVVQRVYYLYGRATSLALLLALGTASVDLCGVHPFLLFFVPQQHVTAAHDAAPRHTAAVGEVGGSARRYPTPPSGTPVRYYSAFGIVPISSRAVLQHVLAFECQIGLLGLRALYGVVLLG